jgi:hypothetical protein
MAQVGPRRERPVRDGLALISPLSLLQVASGRSQFSVFRAEFSVLFLSFHRCWYSDPTFNHSLTEEVSPNFQPAMSHFQVEGVSCIPGVVFWQKWYAVASVIF